MTAAQKHYQEAGEPLHEIEKALTPEMAKKSLIAVAALAVDFQNAIELRLLARSSKLLIIDGQDFRNTSSCRE